MKKLLYSGCAVLMLAGAAAIWYFLGITTWTLIAGLLLLACPAFIVIASLREARRTDREIQRTVVSELRRRHS